MSDYQRIVSYLYEYNHGVKGANVGFARIEKRHNQIKVYFHVKTNESSLPYKIYFYHFHEGTMEGTFLDSFQKTDTVVEMKLTFPLLVDLSTMDGFLIYHSQQLFYGSEWNDKPITIRNFLPLETVPAKEAPSRENISANEDISPEEEISPEKTIPSEKDIPPKEETTSNLAEYIEALQLEQEAKESTLSSTPEEFDWKEFPSLPNMSPSHFDPCIKIDLDDFKKIKSFPKKLPKNGFLLLNYGNYGYLMLGKHKDTGQTYIGVPGTFDNEKNYIAKFFGFDHFITVPQKNQKTGNFGYWILAI